MPSFLSRKETRRKKGREERRERRKRDGTIIATVLFFHSKENWKRRDEINACSRKWIITRDNLGPLSRVYHSSVKSYGGRSERVVAGNEWMEEEESHGRGEKSQRRKQRAKTDPLSSINQTSIDSNPPRSHPPFAFFQSDRSSIDPLPLLLPVIPFLLEESRRYGHDIGDDNKNHDQYYASERGKSCAKWAKVSQDLLVNMNLSID